SRATGDESRKERGMDTVSGKYYVGSLELRTVSDGTLFMPATRALPSASPDELERWVTTDGEGYLAMGISSLVFRSQGKTILVDTGMGTRGMRPGMRRNTGYLLQNL